MQRKVCVFLTILLVAVLTQVAGAREHILLSHVDHGKSTVIASASQATDGIVLELKQGNLAGAGQQFNALHTLVGLLGEGLEDQTVAIRMEAFEVLGLLLANLQDSLVANEPHWGASERMSGFLNTELTRIGDQAAPMIMAGLRDSEAQVRIRSTLVIGVLLGGQVDFQNPSFRMDVGRVGVSFNVNYTMASSQREMILPQLQLLKEDPEMAKWIEVLSAISDKVHDMIEAAAE